MLLLVVADCAVGTDHRTARDDTSKSREGKAEEVK